MLLTLRVHIANLERWDSTLLKMMGMVELILAVMLIIAGIVSLILGEDSLIFLYPVPVLVGMGLFQYFSFRRTHSVAPAVGVLMIILAWMIAFIVSMVPFYLGGFSMVDSIFQSVSGFTTTGASVITDFDSVPRSLLFWTALIEWAGGIAIVLLFVFIIPTIGMGRRVFMNNETSGYGESNFSMKMWNAAKSFMAIYLFLTAAEILLLLVCGVAPFEAVSTSLSTISTGGATVHSAGIDSYPMVVQAIVLVFMFLGGTSFYLHYRALYKRDITAYAKSQEFIWTSIWLIVATLAVSVIVFTQSNLYGTEVVGGYTSSLWDTLFTIVSIGTTTGFTVAEHVLWPPAALIIIMIVGILGSMSGSTSGGIKVYRLMIVKSFISNGIYKMLHPRTVKEVKLDDHFVEHESVTSAIVMTFLFIFSLIVATFVVLALEDGLTITDAAALATASLSTAGIGFSGTEFSQLGDVTRIFLSFVMWIGRMEIVLALCLFTRTFWNDVALGIKREKDSRPQRRIKHSSTVGRKKN
jgi:trk system potassium uptake protein TrkH